MGLQILMLVFVLTLPHPIEADMSPPVTVLCKTFYYEGLDPSYNWAEKVPVTDLGVYIWWYNETGGYWRYLGYRYTDDYGRICINGSADGRYWFGYIYGGQYRYTTHEINCSQMNWELENYLPAKGGNIIESANRGLLARGS